MGIKNLIDASPAPLISLAVEEPEVPMGMAVVTPTHRFPGYEMVFWTGQFRQYPDGVVCPDLNRCGAHLGLAGVKEEDGKLNYDDLLRIKQAERQMRVDGILGPMPAEADGDRDAYVEYANQLMSEENLRQLGSMGVTFNKRTQLRVGQHLAELRRRSQGASEERLLEKGIETARNTLEAWTLLIRKLANEGSAPVEPEAPVKKSAKA